MGYDGDVVCVFASLDEARDHLEGGAAGGSRILAIAVPADDDEAGTARYDRPLHYGYYSPARAVVAEGYEAIVGGVPAEWILGEAA